MIKLFQGFTNCTGYHLAIAVINFSFHGFLDLDLNIYLQNKFWLTTQYQTGLCIWCFFFLLLLCFLFSTLSMAYLTNRQSLMVLHSLLVKLQEITSSFISKVKIKETISRSLQSHWKWWYTQWIFLLDVGEKELSGLGSKREMIYFLHHTYVAVVLLLNTEMERFRRQQLGARIKAGKCSSKLSFPNRKPIGGLCFLVSLWNTIIITNRWPCNAVINRLVALLTKTNKVKHDIH